MTRPEPAVNATDRRHHSRIAFHARAALAFDDGAREVVILDLSLKGALIRLPAGSTIAEAMPCTLRMHLDEAGDEIVMEAVVSHVEGRYAGLLCRSIDLDSITHLRRLVELNLGQPELLDRELAALLPE